MANVGITGAPPPPPSSQFKKDATHKPGLAPPPPPRGHGLPPPPPPSSSHPGQDDKAKSKDKSSRVPLITDAKDNRLKRETPFVCSVRFKNDLPEVPCDPKVLLSPIQTDKLGSFWLTSLERNLRRDLVVHPDLGIKISLLDLQRYTAPDVPPQLDPKDKELLEGVEEGAAGAGRRSHPAARLQGDLSWLMRTSYISNEYGSVKRQGIGRGQVMRRVAADEDEMDGELTDRESQIAAIERTFEAAQRPPQHPKNPNLKPVEILPLVPDFRNFGYHFVNVNFDDDPMVDVPHLAKQPMDMKEYAAERSVLTYQLKDKDNQKIPCVAYLTPKEVPMEPSDSSEEYMAYDWTREYTFEVKYEDDRQRTFLFNFDGDEVKYVDLNTKLELRKPGVEGKQQLRNVEIAEEVRIFKRPLTDDEERGRLKRMKECGWDQPTCDFVREYFEDAPAARDEAQEEEDY